MHDALKPAIKRLRDGCDATRRVEESMVAAAALGHSAILEEQANLLQVHCAAPAPACTASALKHTCILAHACGLRELLTSNVRRRNGCTRTRGLRW